MSSEARIHVRVTPRSSRNVISTSAENLVKVWVTASPTDGQANTAVCELLAKKLGTPKTSVSIVRGEASRDKVIAVQGLDLDEVFDRLKL